jgi:hypothetical protein
MESDNASECNGNFEKDARPEENDALIPGYKYALVSTFIKNVQRIDCGALRAELALDSRSPSISVFFLLLKSHRQQKVLLQGSNTPCQSGVITGRIFIHEKGEAAKDVRRK